ncbi:gluconokinase [Synechococcus sp. PCC 7336]|uniref:gluconokinase n=1 Tax=Synechococcus sp. PCC 7336 TaxID=195250 RepID=UPI00034D1598|nr:gluconokinase [Synechococcus sp. PCC 7336]
MTVVLIMGVSGSGKTTVGQLLARELGWTFYDADDFHLPENLAKMSRGIALDDRDRAPWLDSLRQLIQTQLQQHRSIVLACSALKASYRDRLLQNCPNVHLVYLQGSYDTIKARLKQRQGHYAKADLLDSQFAALEVPDNAIAVPIDRPPDAIVREVADELKRRSG